MNWERFRPLIEAALAEDIGRGDITTEALVPEAVKAAGSIAAGESGVAAGLAMVSVVYQVLDDAVTVHCLSEDGHRVERAQEVCRVEGPARSLLTGERLALNFLGRLSGIATLTAKFVAAVGGLSCAILDTRKTTPGIRALEKYAVRMGGGVNHRFGLYDAVLVKDNHIALAGGVGEATRRAAAQAAGMRIEIEVRSLEEAAEAVSEGANALLLDHFRPEGLAQVRARVGDAVFLEASGNVSLEKVRAFAEAGADGISIGALTHSAPALDFTMNLCPPAERVSGG